MQAETNEHHARRPDRHRLALAGVSALGAIIVALMWLAPVPGGASDLDALPATAALGAPSSSEATAVASASAGASFHADAKLDHLSAEADPSPTSIAAYGN